LWAPLDHNVLLAQAADPSAADAVEATTNESPAIDQDSTPPDADAAPPSEANGAADASTAETEEDDESASSHFWDELLNSGAMGLMIKGGFFMWIILPMAVIAVGVIIERYRSLKMLTTDTGEVRDRVGELLQNDQVEEALELCDREQGPVPAILSAGLRKYLVLRRLNYDPGKIEEQVVKGMDDYSVHVVAALERHLPILATISSVAPMLGFLGTVAGMIISFENIDANFGNANIVKLAAGGISVALLTTAFGLIVGIPTFMAYNYFTSVINRFVLEVEESATELIETVTLQLTLAQRE
ncbi:MAG: MotA/TolQ/ExbB proton channel family protein, partial [Pirellulales bacterium]